MYQFLSNMYVVSYIVILISLPLMLFGIKVAPLMFVSSALLFLVCWITRKVML